MMWLEIRKYNTMKIFDIFMKAKNIRPILQILRLL